MKISKKLLFTGIVSLLIFILILIEIISKGFLINIDGSINSIIPVFQNSSLTFISKIIHYLFDTPSMIIISLLISAYLWIKKYRKESIFFIIVMLADALSIFLLKELVQRARPLTGIISETGFSFPSGHSATAVVFFGLLTYLILKKNNSNKIKILSILISVSAILLIGLSRLYLNVHWLTDILAGFSLGVFILSIGIMIKELF